MDNEKKHWANTRRSFLGFFKIMRLLKRWGLRAEGAAKLRKEKIEERVERLAGREKKERNTNSFVLEVV